MKIKKTLCNTIMRLRKNVVITHAEYALYSDTKLVIELKVWSSV